MTTLEKGDMVQFTEDVDAEFATIPTGTRAMVDAFLGGGTVRVRVDAEDFEHSKLPSAFDDIAVGVDESQIEASSSVKR